MEITKTVNAMGATYYTDSNGEYHRDDGPAIEYADGSKYWFINGKQHRLDGPAVEHADGSRSWFVYGKRHRFDGPAVEWSDGDKHWYYEGKYIHCNFQEEFERIIRLLVFL